MAMKIGSLTRIRSFSAVYRSLSQSRVIFNSPSASEPQSTSASPAPPADVPGLSSAVLQVGNEPVGPGAAKNTDYKNPEYFCYHQGSYFEAEVELLRYRCPQPSSKK